MWKVPSRTGKKEQIQYVQATKVSNRFAKLEDDEVQDGDVTKTNAKHESMPKKDEYSTAKKQKTNGLRRNSTIIPCDDVRNLFAKLEVDLGEDETDDKVKRDFKSKAVKSNDSRKPRNMSTKLQVMPKRDDFSTL